MVALKLELGPRDPGVTVGWVGGPGQSTIQIPVPMRAGYDVFVAAGSDALPGTGTNLGTFNHNETGDTLSKGLNHAVVHHVQSILYRREEKTPANTTPPSTGWVAPPVYPNGLPKYSGPTPGSMFPAGFHDAQVLRIKRYGATMLATAITAPGVTMAVAATATIVVKAQPGDVAVVNADCTFASNADAIASVAATGVVTGVSVGNTFVRVTNKFNGLVVDVPVAVTGAGVFLAGLEHKLEEEKAAPGGPKTDDDVTRWDDEWPDDRKSVIEQEEKDRKTVLLIEKDRDDKDEKEEKKPRTKAKADDDDDQADEEDKLRAKKEAVDKAIRDKEADSNRNQDTTPADTKARKAHENDKK